MRHYFAEVVAADGDEKKLKEIVADWESHGFTWTPYGALKTAIEEHGGGVA